ncbi:MAG: type I secretion system permease/ATPase [Gammaproteobacteria bacterium]
MHTNLAVELEKIYDENIVVKKRESFSTVVNTAFSEKNKFSQLLPRLLLELEWQGEVWQLAKALPHAARELNIVNLLSVLRSLNFLHCKTKIKLHETAYKNLPCIFINGEDVCLVSKDKSVIEVSEALEIKKTLLTELENINGSAYFFEYVDSTQEINQVKDNWLSLLFNECKPIIKQCWLMSAVLNVILLSFPFFIKAIYDFALPASSNETLFSIGLGSVIAILGLWYFCKIRIYLHGYIVSKLDYEISNKIFEKLVFMPLSMTETVPAGKQIAKLKDFDNARDLMAQITTNLIFDFPFAILFLMAVAWVGGFLVLVPIATSLLTLVVIFLLLPKLFACSKLSAKENQEYKDFLLESLENMRMIRCAGIEKIWQKRHKQKGARMTMANFRLLFMSSLFNVITEVFVLITGLATAAYGALCVINGSLTTGALIAVLMLMWRAIAPIKLLLAMSIKLIQFYGSVKQINQFIELPSEAHNEKLLIQETKHYQKLECERVTLRYSHEYEPALVNINFKIDAGEFVAIVGPNGSGKTSLLKLLLGLYQPQIGKIKMGGINLQQINENSLRHHIGYVPQVTKLFYGTVSQNLQFAKFDATHEELVTATKLANVYEDIMAMPYGFQTRIRDQHHTQLPSGFMQKIALARIYLKDTFIWLLDEPVAGLDNASDEAFMHQLKKNKGNKTILMVTHRPSHLQLADRILVMNYGQIISDGSAADILTQIPRELM